MRRRPCGADDGTAVLEFLFVAIVLFLPLAYVIVAVATVQRSSLAVTQAARDAGRAFATSESASAARVRAAAAVRLAFAGQGLPDDATLRFVAAGRPCTSKAVTPRLAPGAEFTVCVTRRVLLPGVPTVLGGRGIRTVGAYAVHVDDFREVRSGG